jgi:predicted amidohydrolase
MIDKVGFFHFVSKYAYPVEELQTAIEDNREGCVSDALIVLPEAFNIGVEYWRTVPDSRPDGDPIILFKLQELCKRFRLSLVAGLIINIPGQDPPHSSAYLIDASGFGLLCHKRCNDGTGAGPGGGNRYTPNYTPCPDGCDAHNATMYRNLAIAALICVDSDRDYTKFPENGGRHKILTAKLDRATPEGGYRVVCIPSHMKTGPRYPTAEHWRNSFVVLANSSAHRDGPGSYIAEVDGSGVEETRHEVPCREKNAVTVVKLCSSSLQTAKIPCPL